MKKLIVTLLVIAYQFSYSQWELLYPTAPNTTINSFAVSGNNAFAGSTNRGVFLSTDKGQTWQNRRIGKDIKPIRVNSIAISSNNVFVATADSGVYRSENWGDSWEKINNGLLLLDVSSVTASGSYVFAGTNGAGIFFSSDKGNNWTERNNGLTNLNINTIAIEGENAFIGTKGGGIYFSSNKGENWIVKNSGFESKADSIIHSIDIDGNNVIVGTGNGVFLSTDLGENWVRKYPNGEAVSVILKGNTIFAAIGGMVFNSTDLGNNWQTNNYNGLRVYYTQTNNKYVENITVKSIALIDDNIVLAGTLYEGIYVSTNGGDLFESKALVDYNIRTIVTSGENIFISSYSNNQFQTYGGGVWRSTNTGNSWSRTGFQGEGIWSMVLKQDTLFAQHRLNGIYFSTDLGNTWQVKDTTSFPEYAGLRTLVIDGNNWAIATTSYGVLISTDSGNSWEIKNDGFDTGIYSVAFDGNNIFAGTGGTQGGKGVFLSTNMGDSWEQKGLDGLHIFALKVSGNFVFAGTNDGFYSSSDYGETWELKFKDNISTSTLAFELYNGILIIGVSGNNGANQVHVSTDMGESWTRKDETSKDSDTPFSNYGNSVQDFAVNGEYIYAVVRQSMIFKAKLSELVPTSINKIVSKHKLLIYPNPAVDYIEISQPSESSEIRIYNVMGLEVLSETIHPMSLRHRMNVEHLPAGVYFIRIGEQMSMFVKQ